MSTNFTIKPTQAGFTDQLIEIDVIGHLGTALGLSYQYHPIFNTRASPPVRSKWLGRRLSRFLSPHRRRDIHFLLGITDALSKRAEGIVAEYTYDLLLSDDKMSGVQSFEDVAAATMSLLTPSTDAVPAIQLRGAKKFFRYFWERRESFIDFEDAILRAERRWRRKKWQIANGVLVHFRAGDIAVVEDTNSMFLPLRKSVPRRFQPHATPADADPLWISASEMCRCIEENHLIPVNRVRSDLMVCSDGFNRAIDTINETNQWAWKNQENTRLQAEFHRLSPRSRISIGESLEDLLSLVNGLMTCRKVITKDAGVLVLKFLSLFRRSDLPEVVVLHKGRKPDYNIVDTGLFGDRLQFVPCPE